MTTPANSLARLIKSLSENERKNRPAVLSVTPMEEHVKDAEAADNWRHLKGAIFGVPGKDPYMQIPPELPDGGEKITITWDKETI